jgi:putative transposase
MNDFHSLSHTPWDGKHHLVWIPKYRKKAIYGDIRRYLGETLKELALQKESKILEGHVRRDHLHMLVSIPPKYSVAQVVGYIKGKSAFHIARTYGGHRANFAGQNFWARGYFVSTVGADEAAIRSYIVRQEENDRQIDQMNMFQG